MTSRLPSTPPILPGLAYVRPLGSGGFADVFLYEQDMPRRNASHATGFSSISFNMAGLREDLRR